ncbi:hypothetical protein ABT026_28275 [Streptomyces sp. NPDC002734]|uniref:hypothetical protein n=1 Tax=Streptomyces sp. NPDC002734 TaxID=3154426 RepID=UPI003333D9CC
MAWDEWAKLKAEAAARTEPGMRLNQLDAPAGGGGGTGGEDLVVHDDQLGKLGNMAFELRERLHRDGDFARPATFRASVDMANDGLDTGSALTEVHDAWNTQLRTLLEACAHISNHLDFSRTQHAKDEDHVVTGMRDAGGGLMSVSRINDYFE